MSNTKVNYLYRDASNYKNYNEEIVEGEISPEQIAVIMDCLDGKQFFIPSQVGLPEARFPEQNEDDHCWFELEEHGFSPTEQKATIELSVDELVNNFINKKGKWDDTLYKIMA